MDKKYFVGASGWSYGNWKTAFYPTGMPARAWLSHYATQFNTVELNATFYRLPTTKAVAGWNEQTPDSFVFAVKLSRLITHLKRLKVDGQTEEALAQFLAVLGGLGHKLGVVLVQLPASVHANVPLLSTFIAALSAAIAGSNVRPRIAIEFRHASWFTPETFALLKAHNIASVWNDGPPSMAVDMTPTADFRYVRLHGVELYKSCYTQEELQAWAGRIASSDASAAFVYFNNTMHLHALDNARNMRQLFV